MILRVCLGRTKSWTVGNVENRGSRVDQSNRDADELQGMADPQNSERVIIEHIGLCLQLNLRQITPQKSICNGFIVTLVSDVH